jgi:hypothetical protein
MDQTGKLTRNKMLKSYSLHSKNLQLRLNYSAKFLKDPIQIQTDKQRPKLYGAKVDKIFTTVYLHN